MRFVLFCMLSTLIFITVGCNTTDNSNDATKKKQNPDKDNSYNLKLNTMLGEMNAAKKPQNHINSIRRYALDNFSSLTQKEYDLIVKTNPRIYKNSNTMEYCFAWILPEKKGYLEVLATPPPDCTPMAVFRRNEIYFP